MADFLELFCPCGNFLCKDLNLYPCRAGCQWTVRSLLEYRTYQAPDSTAGAPHLTLLLQVDGSGHAGEGYRFAVNSERISATGVYVTGMRARRREGQALGQACGDR
jgi:hypothetical protein